MPGYLRFELDVESGVGQEQSGNQPRCEGKGDEYRSDASFLPGHALLFGHGPDKAGIKLRRNSQAAKDLVFLPAHKDPSLRRIGG